MLDETPLSINQIAAYGIEHFETSTPDYNENAVQDNIIVWNGCSEASYQAPTTEHEDICDKFKASSVPAENDTEARL